MPANDIAVATTSSTVKSHASLCICTDSHQPSVLVCTKYADGYRRRTNIRPCDANSRCNSKLGCSYILMLK